VGGTSPSRFLSFVALPLLMCQPRRRLPSLTPSLSLSFSPTATPPSQPPPPPPPLTPLSRPATAIAAFDEHANPPSAAHPAHNGAPLFSILAPRRVACSWNAGACSFRACLHPSPCRSRSRFGRLRPCAWHEKHHRLVFVVVSGMNVHRCDPIDD
jgi:hypothetical protein